MIEQSLIQIFKIAPGHFMIAIDKVDLGKAFHVTGTLTVVWIRLIFLKRIVPCGVEQAGMVNRFSGRQGHYVAKSIVWEKSLGAWLKKTKHLRKKHTLFRHGKIDGRNLSQRDRRP